MLSPCPTGWKSEPEESVELVAPRGGSGLFPLYEVFDGARYRINARPTARRWRTTSRGSDASSAAT